MKPYTEVVSAKNVLKTDLGSIGSLDSLVIKQIAQLSNPYSGVFSISRPTVGYEEPVDLFHLKKRKSRNQAWLFADFT